MLPGVAVPSISHSYLDKSARDARARAPSEIRAIKSKANSYTPGDEILGNAKMTSLR